MVRIKNQKSKINDILCLFFLFLASPVFASESLRIAGMGGAFAGLSSTEGAIFGNPAGLINTQANNLSVAMSAQDLNYESLPSGEGEQLNTSLSFGLSPTICYSRTIRGVGIGLGYISRLNNRNTTFKIEDTKAEYIIDERKFISNTETILGYDFFQERGPVLSIGYPLNSKLAIGMRLKYMYRVVKKGAIYRPMRLTAVHGPDVNRNDATKLLPAIIDNLDMDDAIERFKKGEEGHEDVVADLSGSGFDLDLGVQTKLSDSGNITGGFMLDHLIQRRIISPEPSRITLGLKTQPKGWLVTALDLQKAFASSGLNISLGWEVSHSWRRWFSGGIAIRNGYSHGSPEDLFLSKAKDRVSIGISLILGGSHWDYTLVKPIDGSPIHKAAHMFSSTTKF